ncbi:maturation protein [ssRNA phage Esthiorhiza.2_19]|uniref:Maturation protein n=2 Tax=Leviviricetes TaxID=2842243 RepID=A0A8S5L411_9VIRU|nr:maturation protein [ssRNA phage Esthiorhiza.2_19]QDH87794.1 MAG: hypothetical protein H2RhizoLitter491384_000003 [Leviviridae sp.]DAD52156.1 TPA_asm: maturation protein [ssRNA phage Esthiorhiza.2_19]
MRSIPAYRIFQTPFTIGAPGSTQTIWNSTVRALLASEGHLRLANGSWSGGGPFFQSTVEQAHWGLYHHPGHVRSGIAFPGQDVLGVAPCPLSRPVNPTAGMRSKAVAIADVDTYYSSGYSKARPGRPAADLGQFLYELRDFPALPILSSFNKGPKQAFMRWLQGDGPQAVNPLNGRLVRGYSPRRFGTSLLDGAKGRIAPSSTNPAWRALQRLDTYRNLGSEYLNVVFGWEPFVRDLRKVYDLWKTVDKRMAQLVRENGKSIRRKATVTETFSTGQTQAIYGFPWANVNGAPGSFGTGATFYSTTTTNLERVWFTGNFRYFIPDIGSARWTQKARRALFGVQPTPELLWNVLPWSWLIDWFTNVGDCISNLHDGAVENLTVRNSYIMKHTLSSTLYHAHVYRAGLSIGSGSTLTKYPGVDHSFNSFYKVEEKIRDGGWNPFGLHIQLPSLSARQLGILAALGISRGLVK